MKGLDYALLRKIREQERAEAEADVEDEIVPNASVKNLHDSKSQNAPKIPLAKAKESFRECRTTTVMGESLKNILLNPTANKTSMVSDNTNDANANSHIL